MAEVQPPAYIQAGTFSATHDRRANTAHVRKAGILNTGDLGVAAAATANMSVDVVAGEAYVEGDQITNQGFYYVYNDGTVNVAVPTADSTNPRIDLVVARVYDSEFAGTSDTWALEIVEGTPGTNPSPPVAPDNSYILAEVYVAAGTTAIQAGDITQRRQFAGTLSDRYTQIHGHRTAGVVGTPPSTMYDFITVAKSVLITTDGNGEATIAYPSPPGDADYAENFPNGVMSVIAAPGFASPPFFCNVNHGGHTRTSFVIRCYNPDGTQLTNTEVRINYIAVGW